MIELIGGILIGIALTTISLLVGRRNPNLLEKIDQHIPGSTGYFAGSEFEGERLPEDKEVKIL